MNMPTYDRDIIMKRLEEDLIGPFEEDEILNSRPSDVYLTGILWPRKTKMAEESDEKLGLSGYPSLGSDASAAASEEEEVAASIQSRPSTAGISFAVASETKHPGVNLCICFAAYEAVHDDETAKPTVAETPARPRILWKRNAFRIELPEVIFSDTHVLPIDLGKHGAPSGIKLHTRIGQWDTKSLITITLINDSEPEDGIGRAEIEKRTLFQVRMVIRPCKGTLLIARPSRRAILDDDDRTSALLYRNALEFAVGHVCSAEWEHGSEHGTASMIATRWIPRVIVPSVSAAGHEVFDGLRKDPARHPLSAKWLSSAGGKEMVSALTELPRAYTQWIDREESKLSELPVDHRKQAEQNLSHCRAIASRMEEGALLVGGDTLMSEAFRLANGAMLLQHSWDPGKSKRGPLEWRPFQLGFILMAAVSVVMREHPDRNIMDLLWFPTGGGKTEAYLALIAFLAFYRRLASTENDHDSGAGVAAIMRYTLRLLTTQQFVRASSMILACELIRRQRARSESPCSLGQKPFSIGLWVGKDATPNSYDEAAASLGGSQDQSSPKQLSDCPACRGPLTWYPNSGTKTIHVKCDNHKCILYDPKDPLPVYTVDEDMYREKPTLVIATIDKFAQIARRGEVNSFFGIDVRKTPDLILQDELHLISGPLGTIAGLYETAIDQLFSINGTKPKVIGSTATIRRAPEQVRALFNREICQFPPPAVTADDSCFSVVDRDAPGRMYTGVTTAGRSAKFTLQAVAASLLQSAIAGFPDDVMRDPYWTLVLYFNSLRELGGALVLMQDDVNDSIGIISARRNEMKREPKMIEELTSRRTQAEVRDMLDQLAKKAGNDDALDIVLATNMLSVGVDIPRLGMMLVNGQPKGIAEYIQATSRVGRGQVSGLIVTVLNNSKARDRSHYEAFSTWHETLYRDVEATSVTPYASRARDRALHAVLVTLVRNLIPENLMTPSLVDSSASKVIELIDVIVERAKSIDPDEHFVKKELEELIERWKTRNPEYYWHQHKPARSLLQDAERAATLRALGRHPGDAWPTMNNMRSVETLTKFQLDEMVHQEEGGPKNGQ
jgi:hypothetical protein